MENGQAFWVVMLVNTIEEKRVYVENLYKTKSRKTNFVEQAYKANYKVNNDNFFYDVNFRFFNFLKKA